MRQARARRTRGPAAREMHPHAPRRHRSSDRASTPSLGALSRPSLGDSADPGPDFDVTSTSPQPPVRQSYERPTCRSPPEPARYSGRDLEPAPRASQNPASGTQRKRQLMEPTPDPNPAPGIASGAAEGTRTLDIQLGKLKGHDPSRAPSEASSAGPSDCSAGDSSSAAETSSTAQVAAVEAALGALVGTLPSAARREVLERALRRLEDR